ncbi:MAG: NrfD/PsrC family molybdoenzyme membrane anchor subunit [bacterium]
MVIAGFRFKPLAIPACIMALLLLLVAPLCLLLDLEKPIRFLYILNPFFFNYRSPVSWGAWLMVLYPLACLIYLYYLSKGDELKAGILGGITVPLALSVHAYTGFFFALVKTRSYWNTALMPGYFLTSAILSGIALLMIVILVRNKEKEVSLIDDLRKILVPVIAIDLFWAFSWILVLFHGMADARTATLHTISDPLWWFGEVILGMVIPLLILSHPATRKEPFWIKTSCL